MDPLITSGNATTNRNAKHWLVGQFMDDPALQHSEVEVKWATHSKGEKRTEWSPASSIKTITILIRGNVRIDFPEQSITLDKEGEYVLWQNVAHTWEAQEDCVTISVRWPSVN